jgi:hypothetical protein
MPFRTGVATVFRGTESLGDVCYGFNLHDDGRVTGSIVHADCVAPGPAAPRVPNHLLPLAVCKRDLHLSLGDGTGAEFLVVSTLGLIANGRRYEENSRVVRPTEHRV